MTRQYMLDTNVISNLMMKPDGSVASKIEKVGEGSVCCSIVVAGELRYGAEKKGSEKLTRHIEAVLAAIPVLTLNAPVDKTYGFIRNELTAAGRLIGPNDLWIAAHAITENLILVTDNEKEFQRVPSLSVENWVRG